MNTSKNLKQMKNNFRRYQNKTDTRNVGCPSLIFLDAIEQDKCIKKLREDTTD